MHAFNCGQFKTFMDSWRRGVMASPQVLVSGAIVKNAVKSGSRVSKGAGDTDQIAILCMMATFGPSGLNLTCDSNIYAQSYFA